MYRILKSEEPEYKKLVAASKIMEAFSKHDAKYVIQDVWMDLGQGISWSTICRIGFFECQVLYPKDWHNITRAETVDDLLEAVKEVMTDKYWND